MPRARILAIYAHLALLENDRETVEKLLPRLLECFGGRMVFMDHPAYVVARCLHRYRGPDAAVEFARRFLDAIRLERWTPRDELLRFARRDPGAAAQASADMQNAKRHPRAPTPRKPKHT